MSGVISLQGTEDFLGALHLRLSNCGHLPVLSPSSGSVTSLCCHRAVALSPPCALTVLWLPPVSGPPHVGDLNPGGARAAQVSPGKVPKAHPIPRLCSPPPRGDALPRGSRQGLFCLAAHALGSGSHCPALGAFCSLIPTLSAAAALGFLPGFLEGRGS